MKTDLDIVDDIVSRLRGEIRQIVLEEAHHVLRDVEWRHQQTLERQSALQLPSRVTAEDLNLHGKVFLTGYTVTNNSPGAGQIAWASLHIVYNGSDNTITDGNTALKYAYWVPATSTSVLQTSNTKPTLGTGDVLVFVNNAGTAIVAASDSNQSLPTVLAASSVDNNSIATGAVGTTSIANNAVTATQIAASTITTTQISATAGITGTQIASSTIVAGNLGAGAVTAPKLSILQHVLY